MIYFKSEIDRTSNGATYSLRLLTQLMSISERVIAMQAKFHYLQHHALDMLTLAIKHGDLIPAVCCEKCGKPENNRQLDGHHDDYKFVKLYIHGEWFNLDIVAIEYLKTKDNL